MDNKTLELLELFYKQRVYGFMMPTWSKLEDSYKLELSKTLSFKVWCLEFHVKSVINDIKDFLFLK